jgi:trans-aconitate 2-methyltransferase
MPREWDAKAYDGLRLPHQQWGHQVIERLAPHLAPDACVLDAGCGTGRDAAALLDLVPNGRVIAVDASTRMLEQLRAKLADRLNRVEVIHADLTEPLPVSRPADAAMSVAAFHWILDHDTLFARIAAALRPGARFVAECGGQGNIAHVYAAVDELLGLPPKLFNFAGVAETERRLARAGFTDIEVTLTPDPAVFPDAATLHAYLRTVVLGGYLDDMPAERHEDFVAAVAARLPEPVVDYVRLGISATLPARA